MYITYACMSAFCHIDFYDVGVAGVTPKQHDIHTYIHTYIHTCIHARTHAHTHRFYSLVTGQLG